jgi:hypothetical protein
MQRGSPNAISRWAAVLLLPLALPLAFIASIWPGKKSVDRTPDEVIGFIEDFIEGSGGQWDWDEFTSLQITDPRLDDLRRAAALSGPPYDEAKLRSVVARVRAMKFA